MLFNFSMRSAIGLFFSGHTLYIYFLKGSILLLNFDFKILIFPCIFFGSKTESFFQKKFQNFSKSDNGSKEMTFEIKKRKQNTFSKSYSLICQGLSLLSLLDSERNGAKVGNFRKFSKIHFS